MAGMKSGRRRWHLNETFVKISDERHYLWRAVDHEGEVPGSCATKTRDKKAALGFSKKAIPEHGRREVIVTDRLRSYRAALREIGAAHRRETGRWLNVRTAPPLLPSGAVCARHCARHKGQYHCPFGDGFEFA